jgi:hypothetical protein
MAMAQEYKPGQIVPQSGIYTITHDPAHADMSHEVTVIKGRRFPTCRHCKVTMFQLATRPDTPKPSLARCRRCAPRRASKPYSERDSYSMIQSLITKNDDVNEQATAPLMRGAILLVSGLQSPLSNGGNLALIAKAWSSPCVHACLTGRPDLPRRPCLGPRGDFGAKGARSPR